MRWKVLGKKTFLFFENLKHPINFYMQLFIIYRKILHNLFKSCFRILKEFYGQRSLNKMQFIPFQDVFGREDQPSWLSITKMGSRYWNQARDLGRYGDIRMIG